MMKGILEVILSFVILTTGIKAESLCRPVLIVHGILEPADRLEPLAETIRTAPDCPNGRNVTIIHENELLASHTPMWQQVASFQKVMLPYLLNSTDGIHIIGYSQGSIISRGVVQITDNHNVRSLITIAGVHLGITGVPAVQTNFLGSLIMRAADISEICYNHVGQASFSLCRYWRDEKDLDQYKKYSVYLPFINNEVAHNDSEKYKTNLCALKKFVMIASSNDEVVDPFQSGLFASRNANATITQMEDQEIYTTDALGLKTLNDRRSLIRNLTSGVGHINIPNDPDVIKSFIIPHLD